VVYVECFWQRGYGRINYMWRVLGLAVDIHETTLGKGSHRHSTSMYVDVETTRGGSTTPSKRRSVATRGAVWSSGGDSQHQPPSETHVRRALEKV
jgi:hypothetical protein